MGRGLEISSALQAQILAATAAVPAVEMCGLLLGEGLRVVEVRSCGNVADDPAHSFEIDPAALLAAYKAARRGGPQVIGCYHSHPNGLGAPSLRDAAAAEPGSIWIIATGGLLTAWRRDASTFTALAMAGCTDSAAPPQGRG